jgi:hypothetical protein
MRMVRKCIYKRELGQAERLGKIVQRTRRCDESILSPNNLHAATIVGGGFVQPWCLAYVDLKPTAMSFIIQERQLYEEM